MVCGSNSRWYHSVGGVQCLDRCYNSTGVGRQLNTPQTNVCIIIIASMHAIQCHTNQESFTNKTQSIKMF